MNSSQNVLILGFVWPEPQSSAAGSRMMQLIDLFQSEGWQITFASPAGQSPYSADLEQMQINSVKTEMNNSDFDHFVKELNPAIVVFDRFMVEEQFGWRVAEQCPGALRILDTEDLHCLRRARQKAFKEFREFDEDELLSTDVARREIASILRCDLSLIISGYELSLLVRLFKLDECLLHYFPFLIVPADDATVSHWPPFANRQHFISIGNFLHEPNCDSVLFLKQDIWPLIRKQLPQAELHIYGAYPVPKIIQLHDAGQGFLVKGRAEDALVVMQNARVCLAPLRFGAGLKGKLLDAMQSGTPSVTTTIGAEAMHGNLEWNGRIADKACDLADAAVALYTEENLWRKAQTNGVEIVKQRYCKDLFAPTFLTLIEKLQNNLLNHRCQNFTGSMLMHHTMASTKFMSRWIESKNSHKPVI